MDKLTKEFHSFLVNMRYNPEKVNDKVKHYMEHLLRLLSPADEEAVLHYYGILGHEQLSLMEIAHNRQQPEEVTMEEIDNALRRLAITPEWQMMRGMINKTIETNK